MKFLKSVLIAGVVGGCLAVPADSTQALALDATDKRGVGSIDELSTLEMDIQTRYRLATSITSLKGLAGSKCEGCYKPFEDDRGYSAEPPLVRMAEEADDSKEDSLAPNLPPSHKKRNWTLAIALITLFTLVTLLWVYRSSLPRPALLHRIHLPHLPIHLPSSIKSFSVPIPTITSSTFSFSKNKNWDRGSPQFRPDTGSLLRWTEEEDPAFTHPHPSPSWRSKLPLLSSSKAKVNRAGGARGVFSLGDLDEEDSGGMNGRGYEEVGLLPSPRRFGSSVGGGNAGSAGGLNYGSV